MKMLKFSSLRNSATNHIYTHQRSLSTFKISNPFDGSPVKEVECDTEDSFAKLADKSRSVQKNWKQTSLAERIEVLGHFIDWFKHNEDRVATEISQQMGKPLSHAKGEIGGLEERTRAFMQMAPRALGSETIEASEVFTKVVHKEPKGVIMSLAPWNYPLLTAVNSVVPALLAGNSVLLSHGPSCPLTSNTFKDAIDSALNSCYPSGHDFHGLLADFHLPLEPLKNVISTDKKWVDFVSFTGSTKMGREIYGWVGSNTLIDCTLELGGSDAAYVAQEQNEDTFKNAIGTVVDGGFFNAGQSCCGIERVFVHDSIYEEFIKEAAKLTQDDYVLGDPMDPATNQGPLAKLSHVAELEEFVKDAVSKRAEVVVGGKASDDGRFFQPTILANCNESMECCKEEVFGPIISVQKVFSDEEAVEKINKSKYGLTAGIFTSNEDTAMKLFSQLEVGTVFMNRADYLDPFMPWQGRKDTGKGSSLGIDGFRGFYNLKNQHFKVKV